jgi:hypothetical protein
VSWLSSRWRKTKTKCATDEKKNELGKKTKKRQKFKTLSFLVEKN